jgi:hypothetical protein
MQRIFILLLLSLSSFSTQASDLPLANLAYANLLLAADGEQPFTQFELKVSQLTKLSLGKPIDENGAELVEASESRDLLVESGFSLDDKTRIAVVLTQNTHSRELQGKLNFIAQF